VFDAMSLAGMSRLLPSEQHQMVTLHQQLLDEFSSASESVVGRIITEVFESLIVDAKFTGYVPLLTERRARATLRALAPRGEPVKSGV
jgi:hypothetical protein